jgi:hypothetical protein
LIRVKLPWSPWELELLDDGDRMCSRGRM